MLSAIAGLLLVMLVAPLLPGVAGRTKAILTGRRGPPLLQLYYDLARLFRKGVVYSTTTTWMFRLAPVVLAVSALLAACLIPLDGHAAIVGFAGDVIVFTYLLALGRFVLVLASLDTGSSFEGMGASREVTFASFTEVAFFFALIALSLATDSLSFAGMLGAPLVTAWPSAAPSIVMAAATLFVVLLAETSRVPFDDPATHLELTMIHEVMVLDHGGPDLALILYASALKLTLFASIVISVVVPRGMLNPFLALAVLAAGLLAVGIAIGIVESVMARLRLTRVPQVLVAAGALAAFGVILLLR
ncbi:MAG: NADH-quinone oxidoreductase subunit H [Gemmatimonadetes bacterium]|nr:NADH-quinone oxidoreductase subunit H [Gemmatimonadota bacterium]